MPKYYSSWLDTGFVSIAPAHSGVCTLDAPHSQHSDNPRYLLTSLYMVLYMWCWNLNQIVQFSRSFANTTTTAKRKPAVPVGATLIRCFLHMRFPAHSTPPGLCRDNMNT
jgi:hypothetical protein